MKWHLTELSITFKSRFLYLKTRENIGELTIYYVIYVLIWKIIMFINWIFIVLQSFLNLVVLLECMCTVGGKWVSRFSKCDYKYYFILNLKFFKKRTKAICMFCLCINMEVVRRILSVDHCRFFTFHSSYTLRVARSGNVKKLSFLS